MGLVDVGVRLVADNQASFQQAMENSNRSVNSLTSGVDNLVRALNDRLSPANLILGMSLSQYLVRGIDSVLARLRSLTTGSLEVAGRFEQLMEIAHLLAQQQGKTAEETDKIVDSIRKFGIEASIAADLVVQFTRYELDLTKAAQLARVAQDAAQVAGRNSSETLQRILWGIQTYNTETLRTAGITIRTGEAFNAYAKELKKTEENLTSSERSQAMLNAVLAEGAKIAGAYETSLGTAEKVWGSYIRVVNDLQMAIGTPFLEAWRQAGLGLTSFTQEMTKAMSVGGQLYPMLNEAGAWAAAFYGLLNDGSKKAAQAIIQAFTSDLFQSLSGALGNAFNWGFNLITQFGMGIMEGITTVLAVAMDALANMLSFFLAPGSPPRVAPDIDEWGARTLTEYLRGFASADFKVLNSIQGVLKSALSALGLNSKAVEAQWRDLSGTIIAALGGSGGGAAIAAIKNQLGMYGEEVAKLVGMQFELAQATREVEAAENALNQSRKAEEQAGKVLKNTINEYNRLAKTEKDPAKLKAKRDEFLAQREAYKVSVDARKKDEERLKSAQDIIPALEKQVQLQEQLVNTIIELTKKQADTGGGAVGPLKVATPQLPKMEMPKPDTTEFDKKVEAIKEKLKAMFDPLVKQWNEEVKPNLDSIADSLKTIADFIASIKVPPWLTEFANTVGEVVGVLLGFRIIGGIIKGVWGWIVKLFGLNPAGFNAALSAIWKTLVGVGSVFKTGGFLAGLTALGNAGGVVGILKAIGGAFIKLIGPLNLVILGISAIVYVFEHDLFGVRTTVERLFVIITYYWNQFIQWVPGAWASVVNWWNTTWASISGFFVTTWNNLVTTVTQIWGIISTVAQQVWGAVVAWITEAWNKVSAAVAPVWNFIAGILTGIWDMLKQVGMAVWGAFQTQIIGRWDEIRQSALEIWGAISKFFTNLWNGIVKIATDAWKWLRDSITKFWDDTTRRGREAWKGLSSFFTGLWETIKNNIKSAWQSVVTFLSGIWSGIVKGGKDIWGAIGPFLTTLWTGIANVAISAWNGIIGFLGSLWNGVVGILTAVWNGLIDIISVVFNTIFRIAVDIWNIIAGAITGNWEKVKQAATDIWNAILNFFSVVLHSIWRVVESVWNAIVGVLTAIWNGLKATVETVFESIKSVIEVVWNTVKYNLILVWDSLKKSAEDTWEGIKTAINTAVTWVRDTAQGIITGVCDKVKSAWETLKTSAETMWNGIKTAIESVVKPISDAISGILGWLNAAIEAIKIFLGLSGQAASATPPADQTTGKAVGGRTTKNQSYLVGELGPEIFTPNVSGYITPYNAVMNMLSDMMRGKIAINQTVYPVSSYRTMVSQNYSRSEQRNYNLTLQTQMNVVQVKQGFDSMRLLGG